jgi:hypothetical protein
MTSRSIIPIVVLCAAISGVGLAPLSADVVETKDGDRLVGKITRIDAGIVYISTRSLGDLEVKQSEVTGIATDEPVAVRLSDNARADGVLSTVGGVLVITGQNGATTATVETVAASWAEDPIHPDIPAPERHWQYEATVDLNGTAGNQAQLGTSFGCSAKLTTPADVLFLYSVYNREVTDKAVSADQFTAGIDYSGDFAGRWSWFLRDEGGFDRVMGIKFYDTAAAGRGYELVKNTHDELTVRLGLSYRYDSYEEPGTPEVHWPAMDFEVSHALKFSDWELDNKIAAVPVLNNFKNVNVTQDSFYQVPLSDPIWKLRMGVSNIYEGQPPMGIKKVDTTYYTRLLLTWQ